MNKMLSKCMPLACIMGLLTSCFSEQSNLVDVTDYKCQVQSDAIDSPVGEEVEKLIDNDDFSKFLTFKPSASVEFATMKKSRLTSYSIVSGGDVEARDPDSWTLEASNDRAHWTKLNTQKNIKFSDRNQKLEFTISIEENYKYYRFHMSTSNCDILQLSEVELMGYWDQSDQNPIALFEAEKRSFFNQGKVQFFNRSEKAEAFQWYFKGGNPETSTDKNPLVRYSSHGKYPVQLIADNNGLKDTICLPNYVVVKREGAWDQFEYPKINFENKTLGGNGELYKELVPKPEELINAVCLDVCKILYRSVDEIDVLELLDYTIEDIGTISAKGGNPPHINIFFSSSYLKDKKGVMSDRELLNEIVGVLYHELTHGYQYSPKGAGGYAQGTDFFGFLEGTADYVRYKAGYSSLDYRKPGGHWNDGYKTTAFFIDWLHTKDPDFVYKLNQTARTIVPWSWEQATQEILAQSVADLWSEYQQYLASGQTSD